MPILDYKNIILFVALILWFLNRNDKRSWVLFLGLQLIAGSLVEIMGWFLIHYTTFENLLVYNIYMILEFIIVTKMIMYISKRNNFVRTIGNFSLALMVLVFCFYTFQEGGLFKFLNVPLIIGGFLLALQSMVSLFYISSTESGAIRKTAEFWSLASVLFYFLCFIPVFGLINYLMSRNIDLVNQLLTVNDILFVVRYLLIIISIHMLKNRNPSVA